MSLRLTPQPLEVGDTEGFTPEKDIFGRKAIGEGLTHLVTSVADPMVMALDAQWGAGKTTFLKMWAGELRKLGFPVVYFDAFRNDYHDDAFVPLAGEIVGLVQDRKKAETPAALRFFEKAKDAGAILLRSGIRLGVKVATLSAIDTKDFEDIATATAEELGDLADTYVGPILTRHREQEATLDAFREALAGLPALLSEHDTDDAPKPLILIIDELDRCRPVFALALLERMKHFFSVQNVHFVLGTHLGQLRNSVVAAYGQGINAQRYLEKFIQFTVALSDNGRHPHERVSTRYIDYLRQNSGLASPKGDNSEDFFWLVGHVAERHELSLRTIERVVGTLSLALAYTPSTYLRPPPIVAGLAILKTTAPDLYVKARAGTLSISEAVSNLGLTADSDEGRGHQVTWYRQWWRYCTDPSMPEAEVSEVASGLRGYAVRDRFAIVRLMVAQVLDRLTPMNVVG